VWMEESPREVTWSIGGKIGADVVAKAFRLEGAPGMGKRGDSGPVTAAKGCFGVGCGTIVLLFIIVLVLLLLIKVRVDDADSSSGYTSGGRTSGGSFGGSSGGGGHK